MKHNLKHRPMNYVTTEFPRQAIKEYEAWFEGFEAELRERLAEENAIKKRYGPTMIRAFIKEVLGE